MKLTRRLLREVILQEMKLLAEQEAGAEIDISDEDDVEEEATATPPSNITCQPPFGMAGRPIHRASNPRRKK